MAVGKSDAFLSLAGCPTFAAALAAKVGRQDASILKLVYPSRASTMA
jgi:hypothetical protein